MSELNKLLLKEELTNDDVSKIKKMIQDQLVRLFYQLYVKKSFWQR